MFGRIAQRDKIVAKAAGHHVEGDPVTMEMGERGDQLGQRIVVHVDRLHRDQWTHPPSILDDDLSDQPWINKAVIGIDEHAMAIELLAPSRDFDDVADVIPAINVLRLRTRGEDADLAIRYGIAVQHYRSLLDVLSPCGHGSSC